MRRLVFGVILIGGLALSSAWGDLHMDLTGTVVSDSTPGAQDGECIQVGAIATDACYGAGDFGQITSYTADPSYPKWGANTLRILREISLFRPKAAQNPTQPTRRRLRPALRRPRRCRRTWPNW
jgi:hypothetical protein